MAAYETAQAAHERLDEKDPTFEASGTKLLARLDDVESQRGALVQLRSDVSDIKVAVHALDSELTTAKAELAAASSTIAENDRLREAIQEEERRAFREQRDAYLAEQLAEERHRIGADARADADKQLELVKQELEMEKAEKVHLLATVEHLEADAEHAQEMQREHDERAAGAVAFLFGRLGIGLRRGSRRRRGRGASAGTGRPRRRGESPRRRGLSETGDRGRQRTTPSSSRRSSKERRDRQTDDAAPRLSTGPSSRRYEAAARDAASEAGVEIFARRPFWLIRCWTAGVALV